MVIDYLRWQFVLAPGWLLRLLWNLERASLRFFSLKLMARTLFAYWHKDAMTWRGGTISQYLMTKAWNVISRLIGLVVRSAVILTWVAFQMVSLPLALLALLLLVAWPSLVVIGVAVGLALLTV